MKGRLHFVVAALVAAFLGAPLAASGGAVFMPSFEGRGDFGIGRGLKSLSAVAGPDWRETAVKNRTTGLHRLPWDKLVPEVNGIMRKYADPVTGGVGGEPLDAIGEIAQYACLIPGGNRYAWALWRNLFSKDVNTDDPVIAAKLLYGFERSMTGVVPVGKKGEKVDFSPAWHVSHFKTGTYRTSLPGGGHFVSSWSNSFWNLHYRFETSAREVVCHVTPVSTGFYTVTVDGKRTAFTRSKGCTFTVKPGEDGVAEVVLRNSISWGDGKVR